MPDEAPAPSARQIELLEGAYRHVLRHGLADMSLRPLSAAIGTSPRVLLYLFGTKDGLVRALLDRARADELAALARLREASGARSAGLPDVVQEVWEWLVDREHRPLLRLWVEAYARSLLEPHGPWSHFAEATVADWLDVLAASQPARERTGEQGAARRTLALGVLRGCLLDLLATDDEPRVTAAVRHHLQHLRRETDGERRQ